ncbi:phosphoglycerate mutase-like protein AT74 [Selaginella moellendorffii]|nr:phosphoglycerate mutase-like protein AT74 [Selaginella moellendorffii]|eukprot:XP_002966946.2 phosphoglycerate mutase-like protein AT74 [Selaginella moellendorffii]
MMTEESRARRPTRIILVRHGQSEGNVDESKYSSVADYKIHLTEGGFQQAIACGQEVRRIIERDVRDDWKVYFYVSPYKRTRCTLRGIGRAFEKERILGVREEPRIREQDFGNFQCMEVMKVVKETRDRFGRFFYRFPEGESAADVFDRVTSFLESLWRDIDMNRLNRSKSSDLNLIIVSHGLTMRVFLMRWFKWTTEQFELLNNPQNCDIRVMQLGSGGEYSLAVHHSRQELENWGLTPEMIADQEWRATAMRGQWNDDWPWSGRAFFDHFEDEPLGGAHSGVFGDVDSDYKGEQSEWTGDTTCENGDIHLRMPPI